MFNHERLFLTPLLFVFFFHGLLYYVSPEQHYLSESAESSWISYIKYFVLLLAAPLIIKSFSYKNKIAWAALGIGIITTPLLAHLYWSDEGNQLLLQFHIAILGYFFAPYILRYFASNIRIKTAILILVLITFISAVFELLSSGIFQNYARSGFRAAGPFVNPNNTGILVAISAASFHFIFRESKLNILIGTLGLFPIILSGSKTGATIYFVGLALARPLSIPLITALIMLFFASIGIESLAQLRSALGLREFSVESGSIRLSHLEFFMNTIADAQFASVFFGFSNTSLIDNSYLDSLGFGGIYTLTLLLGSQMVSIYSCIVTERKLCLFLHLLLFVSMITTNIIRIWPIAYT